MSTAVKEVRKQVKYNHTTNEYDKVLEPEPCIYTSEELRASVVQRTNDFYNGKMEVIAHDQIKRKSATPN